MRERLCSFLIGKTGPHQHFKYVCDYFNVCLLLLSGEELPTGCVRYADTEEKSCCMGWRRVCEANPVYGLNMYRRGKVNWMLDFAI